MFTEDFEAMGPAPAMAADEYVIWKGKPKKSAKRSVIVGNRNPIFHGLVFLY